MNRTFFLIFIFFQLEDFAQNKRVISGYIKDIATNENIINANIQNNVNTFLGFSNDFGYFSCSVPSSTKSIIISHLSYKSKIFELKNNSINEQVVIYLEEKSTDLNEITFSQGTENDIKNSIIGLNYITIDRLNKIPVILGEKDLIKSLSTTPGVSTTSEISSGLIVRGGSTDQNLILIDGATVYNTSHLFGLVSAFNTDAIKDVKLYKGAFPAKYGGRNSSVLDIILKDGNSKKTVKTLSISPISSKFLIEGPITKSDTNSSYMLSIRASYLSIFLLPKLLTLKFSKQGEAFNYNLYDINSKINKSINKNSNIYFSLYHGHDYWSNLTKTFENKGKFGVNWGNTTLTTRYAINIKNNIFINTLLTATNYQYNIGTKTFRINNNNWETERYLKSNSNINDLSSKVVFSFFPTNFFTFSGGIDFTNHYFKPTFVKSSFELGSEKLDAINSIYLVREGAQFAEIDLKPLRFFHFTGGLRNVNFHYKTTHYKYIEPRLALNISGKKTTLKFGYSNMNQGLHLVSSNSVGLPNDVWIPITDKIAPSNSYIKSIGISHKVSKFLEISIEAYQKTQSNLIDYKLNESFLSNFSKSWQEIIETSGKGKIMGFELFLNKIKGDLTGWLSYSYTDSKRQFEKINNNEWFNSSYNRKHNISLVLSYYNTRKNTNIGFLWNIQSGSAVTLPIALIPGHTQGELGGIWPQYIYGNRNNGFTPIYHRLDLSYEWSRKKKQKKQKPKFTFGVINAYNQTNPLYLKQDSEALLNKNLGTIVGVKTLYKKVGILPVLPFLSYTRTF